MSDVVVFKLCTGDEYDEWYNFLIWMDHKTIHEISTWDDRNYSNTMYKAYKIDQEKDLSYILLKWSVIYKGDYLRWIALDESINKTVYKDEDIIWENK